MPSECMYAFVFHVGRVSGGGGAVSYTLTFRDPPLIEKERRNAGRTACMFRGNISAGGLLRVRYWY